MDFFFPFKVNNILWEKANLAWCCLFFLGIINIFLIEFILQNQIFISQRDFQFISSCTLFVVYQTEFKFLIEIIFQVLSNKEAASDIFKLFIHLIYN